ncbi:MAG: hypothetical protein QM529_00025 [Hydrotalea sp.]|nr:hypothetical protein [Hydrotalea sp.]
MKNILHNRFVAIFIGLLVAFVVMTLFEFVNYVLYPFPQDMDKMDMVALKSFTDGLPLTAFLMVLAGWFFGGMAGGYVACKLSGRGQSLSIAIGFLLFIFGLINCFVLLPGIHPTWFLWVGLPLLLVSPCAGHALSKKH